MYPNGGGDIGVMQEVEDLLRKARLEGERVSKILKGTQFNFHVQKEIHAAITELKRRV